MPKIDTSKIPNYATMTPEQKLAALEAFELEDGGTDLERLKNALSKANSEAAEWKKKHNALLSEDEQKKAAETEKFNALNTELETLRKEKSIGVNKANLLSLGFDDTLATETAEALFNGDHATVFANQKKFLDERDKKLRAELLKQTPQPPNGGQGVEPQPKNAMESIALKLKT